MEDLFSGMSVFLVANLMLEQNPIDEQCSDVLLFPKKL